MAPKLCKLPKPWAVVVRACELSNTKKRIKWMWPNLRQPVWVGTRGDLLRWDKPRGGCYRAGYYGWLLVFSFFCGRSFRPSTNAALGGCPFAHMMDCYWPWTLTHIPSQMLAFELSTGNNQTITSLAWSKQHPWFPRPIWNVDSALLPAQIQMSSGPQKLGYLVDI